jgi:tetratricopeptide (TPR) repeat protein
MRGNYLKKFRLLFFLFYFFTSLSAEDTLQQAYESYVAGGNADNLFQRQTAFNRALALYKQVEQELHESNKIGPLYYNIANTFYQLGDFPRAIWYYERALTFMPHDARIQTLMDQAREKLDAPPYVSQQTWVDVILGLRIFSIFERLYLFFIFGLITLILISIFIWYRIPIFKIFFSLTSAIALYFLISALYTNYFSPVEGVLISSTGLYREAGSQELVFSDRVLIRGTKVKVLEIQENGKWLKIKTPDGQLGFVPFEVIRII